MATLEASGTQTATLTTEHTLTTLSSSKPLQFVVDAANLAAGEQLRIRIKTKTLSAGTTRVFDEAWFFGVQGTPILVSPPILSDQEYVVTLTQYNGTGRSFPWKVLSP